MIQEKEQIIEGYERRLIGVPQSEHELLTLKTDVADIGHAQVKLGNVQLGDEEGLRKYVESIGAS